jgi:hypothetical protein
VVVINLAVLARLEVDRTGMTVRVCIERFAVLKHNQCNEISEPKREVYHDGRESDEIERYKARMRPEVGHPDRVAGLADLAELKVYHVDENGFNRRVLVLVCTRQCVLERKGMSALISRTRNALTLHT